MRRGYIRLLFGDRHPDIKKGALSRRCKIDNDVKLLLTSPHEPPFVSYTFGSDNHAYLLDLGVDSRLLDKRPYAWDKVKEPMRHKLEAFKVGMEEFDEILFLDWDCMATQPVPADMWDKMRAKSDFQALLRYYHRRMLRAWRDTDFRKIPCASFVYMGSREVPSDIIGIWEEMGRPWKEELPMAVYADRRLGGWKGVEAYWNNFEPMFFHLREGCVYDKAWLSRKNIIYRHFRKNIISKMLKSEKTWKEKFNICG